MTQTHGDPRDGLVVSDPLDPFETRAGPFYSPPAEDPDWHVILFAEARHCNTSGMVHGGLLVTMSDLSMCVTANRQVAGERSVTISLNADFISSGRVGDVIVARSEVTRRTKSMVFVRCRIAAAERTLVTASAVLKRIPPDPDAQPGG